MRQQLFKLFQRFFGPQLDQLKTQTVQEYAAQRESKRQASELVVMNDWVGKPVICLSNEYDNPVVGFVKEVQLITKGNCPVLIVSDYISYEDVMVLGQTFEFSQGLLQFVYTVDRMRLNDLLYKHGSKQTYRMPAEPLLTYDQASKRLVARGFIDKVTYLWQMERAQNETPGIGKQFYSGAEPPLKT